MLQVVVFARIPRQKWLSAERRIAPEYAAAAAQTVLLISPFLFMHRLEKDTQVRSSKLPSKMNLGNN
jgi:hypothetical protein